MLKHTALIIALALMLARHPAAQTDPRTLPLFDPTAIKYAGVIIIPGADSRGAGLNYGAGASGFSEDGTKLYVACQSNSTGVPSTGRGMIWTGTVPAIGGVSKEIAPCTGLTIAQLGAGIAPGVSNPYFPLLGGVIEKNGKVIVNGYITYDAGSQAQRYTWWNGTSFSQLNGPTEGTTRNGLVMRDQSRVPPEWQSLLGGDLGVSTGYSSIISRASYGMSFSTFYARDVGTPNFRINFLLGCPVRDPDTGADLPQCSAFYQHGSPSNLTRYGGSEESAGVFMVPNTRTLVALVREAKGPMCYGYATRIAADHNKPYLDAVYCYSLSDPLLEKGPKGFPYVFIALLYDANDLVLVKNGSKKPWDVVPYATHVMPTSTDDFRVGYTGSAAFNALTGNHYLFRELWPNGSGGGNVDVFSGFPREGAAPTQPAMTRLRVG